MPDDTLEVLLRLRGGQEFTAQVKAADRSVAQLGDATRTAGRHADASRSTFSRLSNTFWTFRNMAYIAGSALTGFGLGAIAVQGLQFDATMEQNTTSFKHFLGSTRAATKYLDDLYKLAATTPFEFQPLATAAKQMLAFGFTSRGALDTLRSIGDAVSGLGTGTEGIDRIVLAFGQMKSAGVVQGDELRQLQEAGINANKYLIQAGLIKRSDIGKIGLLHLDSTKAIAAIVAGMNREFGGLSAKQAQTFTGQLSTARDYAKQFLGVITQPAFDWLRTKVLPGTNRELGHLQEAFKIAGVRGLAVEFDDLVGANGRLIGAFDHIGRIFRSLGGIIRQLPLADLATLLGATLYGALVLLDGALGFVNHHFHTLVAVLGPVVAAFAAYRIAVVATAAVSAALEVWGLVAGFIALSGAIGVAGAAMVVLDILFAPVALVAAAIVGIGVAFYLLFTRVGGFRHAMEATWHAITAGAGAVIGFVRSHWPVLLAILAGPFGLAVLMVVRHFGAIRRAVGSVVSWIRGHWRLLASILGGPFVAAGLFIASHFRQIVSFVAGMPHRIARAAHGMWDGIKQAFRSAINWIIGAWNSLHFRIPGFDPPGPGPKFGGVTIGVPHIPLLATGGSIVGGGVAIVGDKGPEIVELPAGARVAPLDARRESDVGPLQPIQLVVDGRVLAETTLRHALRARDRG